MIPAQITEAPCSTWLGRIVNFTLDRNNTVWGRDLAPRLIETLVSCPVRCFITNGRFRHPPEDLLVEDPLLGIVGWVTEATADQRAVYARIHVEAPAVRRALAMAEHGGRLTDVGLSLVGRVRMEQRWQISRWVNLVTEIREMYSVDFVSSPALDGALLRSLPEEAAE